MANKPVVAPPASLQSMIAEHLVQDDDRSPEQIIESIINANMQAETLDDLFQEVTSAKDEFCNKPFKTESIEFRKSSIGSGAGEGSIYALLHVITRDEHRYTVSCSAPDVYSKLLAMKRMGVLEETPVVIRAKQTRQDLTVLKLERVKLDEWESGELF